MNKNFFTKKFKLNEEQIQIYIWLKGQNINTKDETLCYWSKTYSSVRIKEVVQFANVRFASGQKIFNVGGWINNFLKNQNAVVNNTCQLNQNYAIEFAKIRKWKDLRIYEKYVKDNVTKDDLPLTLSRDEFEYSLNKLYEKSQIYK